MLFRFAFRNFFRQGARAWLNVLVTGLSIVAIVFNISLLNGFQAQATRNMSLTDVGGGHYVAPGLDLLTPSEWESRTSAVPDSLRNSKPEEKAEVLIQQGQIFPRNRLYPVQLRGIDMEQKLLDLPLDALRREKPEFGDDVPVVIGARMAAKAHLKAGDSVVLKWRDRFGAVDARNAKILDVVRIANPRIDEGVIWFRLDHLRRMTQRDGEVSWIAVNRFRGDMADMEFHGVERLMSDLLNLLRNDRRNAKIFWAILMFLSGISIFNTQILNVFKRQKEIGTLMAMGMDDPQVVRAFTLEGAIAAVSSVACAAAIGVPLLSWFQSVGLDISHLKETAIPVQENIRLDIHPVEVAMTAFLVSSLMIIISWLPVRKISRMDVTRALRGRALK